MAFPALVTEFQMSSQKLHRIRFRTDEDQLLMDVIRRFGCESWSLIAAYVPERNARQCRDRWKHYLLPQLKRDAQQHASKARMPIHTNHLAGRFLPVPAIECGVAPPISTIPGTSESSPGATPEETSMAADDQPGNTQSELLPELWSGTEKLTEYPSFSWFE
jgi:hypothetical protein